MNHGLEHDALIYADQEALVDTLVPWLQEGQAHGDGAVVATTAPRMALLRDALGADGDAVSFISADELYVQPGQTIATWQRVLVDAAAAGVAYTRIVGEVTFGATPDEQTSWTRYESALNAVFERSPAWIVCPYDVLALPPTVIDQAWRTHPTVWDPTRHKSDRYEAPARLLREIVEPGRAVTGAPDLDLGIDGRMSEMRELVRTAGLRAGLAGARVEELVLAVSELAGNTVRHAGGGGRLSLWTTSDGIVCDVTDRGAGVRDPLAGLLPPKPNASTGMGLWIARQLSDSFAIDAGEDGTVVRIAVDR